MSTVEFSRYRPINRSRNSCMKTPCLAAIVVGVIAIPLAAAGQPPAVQREALPKIMRPTTPPRSGPVNPDARVLAGTGSDAFTTIQGSVLTSSNGMLTDGTVRLRDARFGRIVDVTTTDNAGVLVFRQVM